MIRKLLSVAAIAFACSIIIAADDEKKPADNKDGKKGGFDRSKMYEKMDTNGDGKVSKDEYVKSMETLLSRFSKGGNTRGNMKEMMEKRFDSIDTNKDGFLSKDEFEKSTSNFGGFGNRGTRGKGKGKTPGTDTKPADPEKKADEK
jgi:hypothetical protein